MKECPECSMFNVENAAKCKYCGASLGGGGAVAETPVPRKSEDPGDKEQRLKDEKRKKIVTYAGYGIIAAALVGYMVYMQVKKGKEPKRDAKKVPAADVDRTEQPPDEAGKDDTRPASPKLGSEIKLEAAGLSFKSFAGAIVEGEGDAAVREPDLLVDLSSEDGNLSLTVRRADNPDGSNPPSPSETARIEADYVLAKDRPVLIPGKKKGKTKAGPYVMFEGDLGQDLERVYYVFTPSARVEFLFSYPADEEIEGREALIHAIMSSIAALEAAAPPPPPGTVEPAEEKPAKSAPVKAAPVKAAPAKPAVEPATP